MPKNNKSKQERLVDLKIVTRYSEESQQLINLGYSPEQADRLIIRPSSALTIKMLIKTHHDLRSFLNHEQITSIASHAGGSKNIEGIIKYKQSLLDAEFTISDLVSLSSHIGGSQCLKAVADYHLRLRDLQFKKDSIKHIASHDGGSQNLKTVLDKWEELQNLKFSNASIERMVSHQGGANNLKAVLKYYLELQALNFSNEAIEKFVSRIGGSNNLKALLANYNKLKDLGYTTRDIKKMVSETGGSLNIKAAVELAALANDLNIPLKPLLQPKDRLLFWNQLQQAALSQNKEFSAVLMNQVERLFTESPDDQNLAISVEPTEPASHTIIQPEQYDAEKQERLVQFKIVDRYDNEFKTLIGLGYSQEQADKLIIKRSSAVTIQNLFTLHKDVITFLDHEQITCIASCTGGSKNLESIIKYKQSLMDKQFSLSDIVIMASHTGGTQCLEAVVNNYNKLSSLKFDNESIKQMASHTGGAMNLTAAVELGTLATDLNIPVIPILNVSDRIRFQQQLKQAALIQNRNNIALQLDQLEPLFEQLEPLFTELPSEHRSETITGATQLPHQSVSVATNNNSFFVSSVEHINDNDPITGIKRPREMIDDALLSPVFEEFF